MPISTKRLANGMYLAFRLLQGFVFFQFRVVRFGGLSKPQNTSILHRQKLQKKLLSTRKKLSTILSKNCDAKDYVLMLGVFS